MLSRFEEVRAIVVFPAAVKRPWASTVNVPTVAAPPYEPPVTVVLSKSRVIVSVKLAVDVRPIPPLIVNVSVPEVIVWFDPESPATVKDVAILASVLFTFEIFSSTYNFVAACPFAVGAETIVTPLNVLFPVIS